MSPRYAQQVETLIEAHGAVAAASTTKIAITIFAGQRYFGD
jgi:hypothetical protein